jgi:hypothetical protein
VIKYSNINHSWAGGFCEQNPHNVLQIPSNTRKTLMSIQISRAALLAPARLEPPSQTNHLVRSRSRLYQQNHLWIRHPRVTPFETQALCVFELGLEVLHHIHSDQLLNIRNMPTTRTEYKSASLTHILVMVTNFNLPNVSWNAPKRPFHSGVNKRSVLLQKPRRVELLRLGITRLIGHDTVLIEFNCLSRWNLISI